MADRRTDSSDEILSLLENLRSGGDQNAVFGRLRELFDGRLRGFFARKGWKPEDCEELVQDTLADVVKGLPSLRSLRAFTGWLFVIARNADRRKRKTLNSIPLSEAAWDIPDPSLSPYDQTRLREQLRMVHSLILNLPPVRQRIFLLKHFQGRENAEIAGILNCTEGTVRVQLHLARKQIKGGVGLNGEEDET